MHPLALAFIGIFLLLFFAAQHVVAAFLDIEAAHHRRVREIETQLEPAYREIAPLDAAQQGRDAE